jgi:hypothetical protein
MSNRISLDKEMKWLNEIEYGCEKHVVEGYCE